jgi:hypothetical protein
VLGLSAKFEAVYRGPNRISVSFPSSKGRKNPVSEKVVFSSYLDIIQDHPENPLESNRTVKCFRALNCEM